MKRQVAKELAYSHALASSRATEFALKQVAFLVDKVMGLYNTWPCRDGTG